MIIIYEGGMVMNYDIVLSKNYQKDLKKARKRYKNIDGCMDAVSNQLKKRCS